MAALNRGAIVAAAANLGDFDQTAGVPLTKLQQLLQTAEGIVWNAADWQFLRVGPTAITFPTTGIVVLPADFGSSLQILDDNGDPLLPLDPLEFERRYQHGIDAGEKATRPESYKVLNGVVQVAPLPSVAIAGKLSYMRRQCHFASDGVTVVAGEMSSDTDLPFWVSAHHMVLVWATLTLAGAAASDISSALWDNSYEATLQAMIGDLTGIDTGAASQSFGRDPL